MQMTVTQRAVARIRPGSICESVPVPPETVDSAERRSPRRPMRVVISMLGLLGTVSTGAVSAADTNAAQQLEYWNAQAGAPDRPRAAGSSSPAGMAASGRAPRVTARRPSTPGDTPERASPWHRSRP